MNEIDWTSEHKETREETLAALEKVRSTGKKKQHQRRMITTAVSSTAVFLAVGVLVSTTILNNDGQSRNNNLAIPATTTTAAPTITAFEPKLASQVIERVQKTYRTLSGISGDLKINEKSNISFKILANGNYYSSNNEGFETRYSAASGTFSDCSTSTNTSTCSVGSGRIDGDIGTYFGYMWGTDLVRSLVNDDNAELSETAFEGKKAWKITIKLPANPMADETGEVTETFIIDQATAMIVSNERRSGSGTLLFSALLTHLTVNPTSTPADFSLPEGATVTNYPDGGAKPMSIQEAGMLVGYTPLQPSALPAGFKLAEVMAGKSLSTEYGVRNTNTLPFKNAVSATYRSGLSKLTVTTRDRISPTTDWTDPIVGEEGEQIVSTKQVAITNGSLKGSTAQLVTTDNAVHLWVVGSELVVTLAGDLSSDELIAAMNSL